MEVQEFLHNQKPLTVLAQWISEGGHSQKEPLAMTLSTVNSSGQPSSRVVLAKEIRDQGTLTGVVFYTNYNSQKGKELSENPKCALNFFWDHLSRQVRIEGMMKPLSAAESDAYWNSRPRASQLSQWVSHQSEPVQSRSELERLYKEAEKKYEGQSVPRPPHWGGYIVVPSRIEFWIGSPVRLHDRFVYTKQVASSDSSKDQWVGQRLSP